MKTANTENPRKNNYFLALVTIDDSKKKTYDIVYTAKTYDTCYNFFKENFSSSVYGSIQRYGDFIREGVPARTLIDFKNPKIY